MSAIGTKSPSHSIPHPIPVKQARSILASTAVETLQAIASDSKMRMEGYPKNYELLGSGIFRPDEYYKALKEMHQSDRIEYFVKKGSFVHGYVSTKHFKMIPQTQSDLYPTGFSKHCFVLKEGIEPTEALAALGGTIALLRCGETCQISYYRAINHLLGDAKFNMLFAANSLTPLKLGQSCENPINYLITATPAGGRMTKGNVRQIDNASIYNIKHVTGEAAVLTTLCCDDTPGKERFTTLGIDPQGLTHAEVDEALMAEFNKDSISIASVTDTVARHLFMGRYDELLPIHKHYANRQISSIAEFKQSEGGKVIMNGELKVAFITTLANSSLKDSRLLFDSFFKRVRVS